MAAAEKIIVSIQLGGDEREVGELVSDQKKIYFKYYSEFIKSGIEISPFKLKLSDQIYTAPPVPFDGLFGVFADSLSDGWGKLLLDRTLISRGTLIEDVTPLQRLSYVGTTGMGALIYRPAIETEDHFSKKIELDAIAREMNKVLEGTASSVIEELYQLGASSGGARPKILVGYNSKTNHLIHGADELPPGYGHWLIKFPSLADRPDVANIEYAYHKMAVAAGIEMSACRLFTGKKGKTYFGTKRFDRNRSRRLHMHSAAGMLHDNFRLSSMDYGHLMDAAFQLENHVIAYEKVLRLAAFNVFAHNRDDHSKNVSFLMNETGEWKLAPAYDLIFSNSSHGFHSTMIMGESRNPGKEHLLKLAGYFRIRKAKHIIEEVQEAVSKWKTFAKKAGVDKISANAIAKKTGELNK